MRHFLLASTCLVAAGRAGRRRNHHLDCRQRTGPHLDRQGRALPDDILINSTGVVNGNAGGGVIIDSNHKLNNQGTIQIGNVSNVAAVDVAAGVTSGITLGGKIIVDEAFTPTDADNDGDLDGAVRHRQQPVRHPHQRCHHRQYPDHKHRARSRSRAITAPASRSAAR